MAVVALAPDPTVWHVAPAPDGMGATHTDAVAHLVGVGGRARCGLRVSRAWEPLDEARHAARECVWCRTRLAVPQPR